MSELGMENVNTIPAAGQKPRRKRRTKAEMEAARTGATTATPKNGNGKATTHTAAAPIEQVKRRRAPQQKKKTPAVAATSVFTPQVLTYPAYVIGGEIFFKASDVLKKK